MHQLTVAWVHLVVAVAHERQNRKGSDAAHPGHVILEPQRSLDLLGHSVQNRSVPFVLDKAVGRPPVLKLPWSAAPVTWMRELLPGDVPPARLGALNTTADVIGVTRNTERDTRTVAVTVVVSGTVIFGTFALFALLRHILPAVYTWRQSASSLPTPASASPEWWRLAHNTTADEGVETSGLDGWMFVEFYSLMCRIFGSVGLLLAAVLCPLHLLAARSNANGLDSKVDLLSRLDIGSVPQGSSLIWVHAMCSWYVVLLCIALIGNANNRFIELRLAWLSGQPQCRGGPAVIDWTGAPFTDSLRLSFLLRWWPGLAPLPFIGELPRGSEVKDAHRMGTWGPSVAPPNLFHQQLSRHSGVPATSQGGAEAERVAFATAMSWQKRVNRLHSIRQRGRWLVNAEAQPPRTLPAREFGSTEALKQVPWEMCGRLCIIMIFLFWSPVVMFISGFTTSDALQTYVPSLRKWGRELPGLGVFLEGVFAALVLKLFMSMLPSILLCIIQNFFLLKAGVEAQLRLERWYYTFLLVFILLVTVFSRSLLITIVQAFQQPSEVVYLLASSLPSTSHFYVNYFVMGWATTSLELLRCGNLVQYLFARLAGDKNPSEAKRCSEPEDQGSYGMGARMALAAFMSTVALVFCTCSPVICVVAWIFFRIGRLAYGYLVLHVETKKPDTGGMFWVEALRQVCFGLAVYVTLTVGVLLRRGASYGPAFVAAGTLPVLYSSWVCLHDLSLGAMHLEASVSDKADKTQDGLPFANGASSC